MAWYGLSHPGVRIAIVAPTYGDARDTCVEGESGLLGVVPPECVEAWNRSLGELILVNGSRYKLFSADEPERLRGPQNHRAWCDELAAWRYPEAWDQLLFGLRLGDDPRVVVTTTPRPTRLIRELVAKETVRITRGATSENAENLAPAALAQLYERYAGTRLGRQELDAELLEDAPGALWTRALLDELRCKPAVVPQLRRIVVAIDPAVTSHEDSDETGIICAGLGVDRHGYVLEDGSGIYSPVAWARQAIAMLKARRGDRIVAEINNGGEMVESTIRMVDPNASFKAVHASRGKVVRAEPVSALYEQRKVHHVGSFPDLEDQMCVFTTDFDRAKDGSPDRVDALVWALSELMVVGPAPIVISDDALAASRRPSSSRFR